MRRLKLELIQWENVINFRVVEQDESLRKRDDGPVKIVYVRDGFSVQSSLTPELSALTLYIRGTIHVEDSTIVVKRFDNVSDACIVVDRIKEAVAVINAEGGEKSEPSKHLEIMEIE